MADPSLLPQKVDHFDYKMHNITSDQYYYLGICLNHKLIWSPHVSHLCNKAIANRLLGFVHRNLRNSPRHIKETAYKQLIFPVLQYCSSIWDHLPTSSSSVTRAQHTLCQVPALSNFHRYLLEFFFPHGQYPNGTALQFATLMKLI